MSKLFYFILFDLDSVATFLPLNHMPEYTDMTCDYKLMFSLKSDLYTVSSRREATWHITEGGLSNEFTSHDFYGENVFQMTG